MKIAPTALLVDQDVTLVVTVMLGKRRLGMLAADSDLTEEPEPGRGRVLHAEGAAHHQRAFRLIIVVVRR